jgi:hypothetical protein
VISSQDAWQRGLRNDRSPGPTGAGGKKKGARGAASKTAGNGKGKQGPAGKGKTQKKKKKRRTSSSSSSAFSAFSSSSSSSSSSSDSDSGHASSDEEVIASQAEPAAAVAEEVPAGPVDGPAESSGNAIRDVSDTATGGDDSSQEFNAGQSLDAPAEGEEDEQDVGGVVGHETDDEEEHEEAQISQEQEVNETAEALVLELLASTAEAEGNLERAQLLRRASKAAVTAAGRY